MKIDSIPADVRAAGTQAVSDYRAALGFEQILAGQLVKELLPAEGPYAGPMQDALAGALVGGQGLGLARQISEWMRS